MSKVILTKIASKQFQEAKEILEKTLNEKIQVKLDEKKKMVAAYSLGKDIQEGKTPKEAIKDVLDKHFKTKKFMSDKDALDKASAEREKDPEFQKWKARKSKK